ncbi:hypothetical protein FJ936_30065 [Mesorhizobium sp. B2-4-13]|uniref:type IV secretory system conjugative DNA transfer family protein n=1 Tax=Mesorhizobium sp. B2-4-13 TaxID=2589936 RepID=UPI001153AAB8|nr:type IV secretory system conjugative DNA transfer family protein [Mesorhizobium sp. B2-4-13]TPK79027.1 hypothetical protein FJ936_30065 [Mesorhizobium sp. B2-4-13]
MIGSLVSARAADHVELWRSYWSTVWHRPVAWSSQRLSCFVTATQGRRDINYSGDPLVTDYPRGRRPFLGVLTNSAGSEPSPESGIVEYNDDGHLLTIAPTRAGKGTAQIVTNLLLYAGSCLVMDIKNENFALTQRHRSTFYEGARVLKFAPFADDSHRYNPLDFIRVNANGSPSSLTFDDTRLLAEMLIPSRPGEEFWDIEARGLLTMILFYVATAHLPGDPSRTMRTVIKLLFPAMTSDDKSPIDRSVGEIRLHAVEMLDEILEAMVTQFYEHEQKVRAGILSTCRSGMAIWLSPRLQRITSASDFKFSDLKRSMCRPPEDNPAPTTLYVVIPPEFLREYRSVLRMVVGLASVELTRPSDWTDEVHLKAGWLEKPPCPVLFLLDEFPSLGYMPPIEQGIAYLAGYGVQIWTFAQSIGQLREIYKENWSTFVSNAGASTYFGMTDPELCEFLSQQLGNTEEWAHRYQTSSTTEGTSFSTSSSRGYNRSTTYGDSSGGGSSGTSWADNDSSSSGDNSSTTVSEQVRFKKDPVALGSEIRALPAGVQLILMRNRRPVLASLMHFHEFGLFESLYDRWGG